MTGMSNAAAATFGLVGSTCTTLTVIGLGKSCATKQLPVCCMDNNYVRHSPFVDGPSRSTELLAERDREPRVCVRRSYVGLEHERSCCCSATICQHPDYFYRSLLLTFTLVSIPKYAGASWIGR
ncbi:hypothetical protein J3R83DRAFT_9724 [Lanmaoa asiatica]|nr:hypothetical protein J3R83DRAFT_9724 [Lanmaoa asiatica]